MGLTLKGLMTDGDWFFMKFITGKLENNDYMINS